MHSSYSLICKIKLFQYFKIWTEKYVNNVKWLISDISIRICISYSNSLWLFQFPRWNSIAFRTPEFPLGLKKCSFSTSSTLKKIKNKGGTNIPKKQPKKVNVLPIWIMSKAYQDQGLLWVATCSYQGCCSLYSTWQPTGLEGVSLVHNFDPHQSFPLGWTLCLLSLSMRYDQLLRPQQRTKKELTSW